MFHRHDSCRKMTFLSSIVLPARKLFVSQAHFFSNPFPLIFFKKCPLKSEYVLTHTNQKLARMQREREREREGERERETKHIRRSCPQSAPHTSHTRLRLRTHTHTHAHARAHTQTQRRTHARTRTHLHWSDSAGNCPFNVGHAACDPLDVGVVGPAGCRAGMGSTWRWREDSAMNWHKCLVEKAAGDAASATAAGAGKYLAPENCSVQRMLRVTPRLLSPCQRSAMLQARRPQAHASRCFAILTRRPCRRRGHSRCSPCVGKAKRLEYICPGEAGIFGCSIKLQGCYCALAGSEAAAAPDIIEA